MELKGDPGGGTGGGTGAFNRTSVELKAQIINLDYARGNPFNRTSVELKDVNNDGTLAPFVVLLIAPVWN